MKFLQRFSIPLLAGAVAVSFHSSVQAGSATWNLNPPTNSWTNPANWTPATVPNGPTDVATFDTSNTTDLSLASSTASPLVLTLDKAVFNSGPSIYTINVTQGISSTQLIFAGAGVVNVIGPGENFTVSATGAFGAGIDFQNSASAGTNVNYTVGGSTSSNPAGIASLSFEDDSEAGFISILNQGSTTGASGNGGGETYFFDSSNMDGASVVNEGGAVAGAAGGYTAVLGTLGGESASVTDNLGGQVAGADGGLTLIQNTANLRNAVMLAEGATVSGAHGGVATFLGHSSAGNGIVIANGGNDGGEDGHVFFTEDSTGGTSYVIPSTTGFIDISQHNGPGLSIGQLGGDGAIFLGSNNLTIVNIGSVTSFEGSIQDGGVAGGTGGSFTSKGIITFTGRNTYSGGRLLMAAALFAQALPTARQPAAAPCLFISALSPARA